MKHASRISAVFVCVALLLVASHARAQMSPDELAKASEAAAAASATTKASPQMIMNKVSQACSLLETEGKAAFSKFRGNDSEFIFAGTYIWVHDMEGVMRMHPIRYKMEGQGLIDMKDVNGKRFFAMMNDIAREKGSGWVDYLWPKPGEKDQSLKVSYVKKCKVDGEDLIVCCGIYDMSAEQATRLTRQ